MTRRSAFVHCAAALLVALAATAPLRAQTAPPRAPDIAVEPDPHDYHALVHVGPVLEDRELAQAAAAGLPVRVRVHTELWRDGFFDALESSADWSTVIVYEPLRERYLVRAVDARGPAKSYASYEAARDAVEGDIPVRLKPRRGGRYYFIATLQIETLTVSDLQELQQWLHGDLQPAVSGDQSIPGAIGAGARRLLIRVLGLPARRIETRSERFRVPGDE